MKHLKICPINPWCESVASQAGCHSFILALLGMVIGSQSTSNGWIGSQLVWLRGFAGSACACSFVFGGAWLCTLALFARHCLHTTARLCHAIFPLSLSFLCYPLTLPPSHLNLEFSQSSPALLRYCFWLAGPQSGTVFLWTSILDFAVKLLSRHSWM